MGDEPFALNKWELVWARYQPFFLSRGYKLRPRYEPGWVGSWKYNGKFVLECEDWKANRWWNILDAIRTKDNIKVTLKMVPTSTEQIPIAQYLSSELLLSDPRNRSVHILDVIPFPDDDDWAFLVMPFLREFDDPPFRFRAECIEALRQMLEGLKFMHEHNVAHRDACSGNIMMDSTRLIPGGFHHVLRASPDGVTWLGPNITRLSRLSVAPVEYFFIDFGLSTRFRSNEERTLVTGIFGQDKTVPELSETVPYDPFKVDIYQMGGVVKKLVEGYHGLRLFRPLAGTMSHPDPDKRPTASASLQHFEQIVSKLGPSARRARVIPYNVWLPTKAWRAVRICLGGESD